MISESLRRNGEQCSPKSSPRAARSPLVQGGVNRQDTTGTLKTTIILGGKQPSILNSGPFYLLKEPAVESELTGAANLIQYYNLEHSYNKFCLGKRQKDQLSSFLQNLPGAADIDVPGNVDNSSLRSLIEKPPIGGKELLPLSQNQLSGFRLHPGPIPEQYRLMAQPSLKKKHKQKKNKHRTSEVSNFESQVESNSADLASGSAHEKKHKKQRKHDDEKERKKKKKDKKKKKQKQVEQTHVVLPNLTNPLLL